MPEVIEQQDTEQPQAKEYAPGELAPAISTQAKIWKPDDFQDKTLSTTLMELVKQCSNTDEAARRFHVVQTWGDRHMDRGYQYMEASRDGGWQVVGANAGKGKNGVADADDANLYPTNILSAQGDIASGALCRGKIKVSFAPKRSKEPADAAATDEANNYVYLWQKNNPDLQRNIADTGWTDSRVFLWTRTVADKRFGVDAQGNPLKREITTAHGVLETKLPMMHDTLKECGYAQVWEETDYAVARATYPWMGNKIKPSWGTFGELEFERIARINTRIGVVGKYITGTSGLRETTMGYVWLRPGMFWDDQVTAVHRDFLLANFPSGVFVVITGKDFCCCWDEALDDHGAVGMYCRGFGQNRRAMGSSDVPIQKRINIWADLWDKFVRKAIPFTVLDSDTYNAEAIGQLEATPGRYLPAKKSEEFQDLQSTFAQSPEAKPIQGMLEMFQWYVGPLLQSIDGCTPALFGGGEGQDNTVGATQIRLQQSLERFGPSWQMMNRVIATAAKQAVCCCRDNQTEELFDTVPSVGDVSVNPANLKGEFEPIEETSNVIPESGAERQVKIMQILDMAQTNPQVASAVGTPSNAREIIRGLQLDDVITIDEANAEDGALEDIERLLDSEPSLNPAYQQLQEQIELLNTAHEGAKSAALQGLDQGAIPDEGVIQQGEQMEQQLQQLQQQLQQTPQFQPSIPVPDDQSLDYTTISATVFSWMQEPDGRSLRRAAQKEDGGPNWKKWTNVFLYWQAAKTLAAKYGKAQAPAPKINITGKLSPEQQAQLLMMQAGIQTSQQELNAPHEEEQTTRLYTPVSEIEQKVKRKRL